MLDNFPVGWRKIEILLTLVGGCRGYVVAGLTENKAKPSSWGLAELGNIDYVVEIVQTECTKKIALFVENVKQVCV